MIENYWILAKGGVLVYCKNYRKLNNTDDNLIASFFSALDSFVKETTKGKIKSIVMKDKKFSYIIGDGLIIVISTNEYDNDILIQSLLKKIKMKFLEKYQEAIINFTGNTALFQNFDEELEEPIIEENISINCQRCKKLILGEFRAKPLTDNKVYFCYALCEENFSCAKYLEEKERN
ncbi:MAG: hypothetical protein ACXACX_21110 [Candidatus Hodarchaeales archaeon]|jgi:hypothetical protein